MHAELMTWFLTMLQTTCIHIHIHQIQSLTLTFELGTLVLNRTQCLLMEIKWTSLFRNPNMHLTIYQAMTNTLSSIPCCDLYLWPRECIDYLCCTFWPIDFEIPSCMQKLWTSHKVIWWHSRLSDEEDLGCPPSFNSVEPWMFCTLAG
jgi:hypothetical protein